jgi:hypothetical protein
MFIVPRSTSLSQVMDGLFLGDSFEAGQKEILKQHNITHILPVGKCLKRNWLEVNDFLVVHFLSAGLNFLDPVFRISSIIPAASMFWIMRTK